MKPASLWRRIASVMGHGFAWLLAIGLTSWAVAALYFDLLPGPYLRLVVASGYGIVMLASLVVFRGRGKGSLNLRRRICPGAGVVAHPEAVE